MDGDKWEKNKQNNLYYECTYFYTNVYIGLELQLF